MYECNLKIIKFAKDTTRRFGKDIRWNGKYLKFLYYTYYSNKVLKSINTSSGIYRSMRLKYNA